MKWMTINNLWIDRLIRFRCVCVCVARSGLLFTHLISLWRPASQSLSLMLIWFAQQFLAAMKLSVYQKRHSTEPAVAKLASCTVHRYHMTLTNIAWRRNWQKWISLLIYFEVIQIYIMKSLFTSELWMRHCFVQCICSSSVDANAWTTSMHTAQHTPIEQV